MPDGISKLPSYKFKNEGGGDSTVVQRSTNNPEIEGSRPADEKWRNVGKTGRDGPVSNVRFSNETCFREKKVKQIFFLFYFPEFGCRAPINILLKNPSP